MTVDRIWYILGKKLSAEATEAELTELDTLLRQHPELYYPIQNIIDLWGVAAPKETMEAKQALQRHLQRLEETTEPQEVKPFYKRYKYGMAAAFIALLGLTGLYFWILPPAVKAKQLPVTAKKSRNEISTRQGSHSKVVLPDGSIVWLNAQSKIEYNKDFDGELREVTLEGEAYFDIARDSSRPFVIHANNVDIKVLGTVFNVKSYKNYGYTETSLIEGAIEVSHASRPDKKIRMKPSEKLIIRDSVKAIADLPDPTIIRTNISYEPADGAITETLWMDNRLVFRNTSFADLAMEFERRYGVVFQFQDETKKEMEFTATFTNESVLQAMTALQLANHFNYYINKDTILITR